MALVEDISLAHSLSILTTEDVIKDRISTNGQKIKGPRRV